MAVESREIDWHRGETVMGHVAWEYLTLEERDRDRLPALGEVGWELAGVGGEADEPILYLKRPAMDFRDRVTLDQRRRYYDLLGLDTGPETDADAR